MIAHFDALPPADAAVEAALAREPLASLAGQTVASFEAISASLSGVGDLAIDYGMGKPLADYQALLTTYQSLIAARAALAENAAQILALAEQAAR